jgi:hypothetical protein
VKEREEGSGNESNGLAIRKDGDKDTKRNQGKTEMNYVACHL